MTRRLIALTISMLLMVSMLPGMAHASSVTASLSVGSARVGDSVTVSGAAESNEWVSIKVLDSDRNIVFFDAVKADSSGKYSCTFIVPAVSSATLDVIAGYGNNTASKSLNITEQAVEITGIAVCGADNAFTAARGGTLQMIAVVTPANAVNPGVTWSVINGTGTAAIDSSTGLLSATGTGTVTVKAMANDSSGIFGSAVITVTTPVTADAGTTVQIADAPTTISVPIANTEPKIQVEAVANQATIPVVQVDAATSLGTIQVSIPSTTVTGPSDWDGIISLPTVQEKSSVTPTSVPGYTNTVQAVIEVGCGDEKLTFAQAVRLLIPGQAGKLAGYSRGGAFTAIPKPADALDTQAWADINIALEKDAALDVGSDLVIWTKHFTKFTAYSQTAVNPGGGGVPNVKGTIVNASNGGTVNESGAIIVIPANASNSDIRVMVEKINNIATLPVPAQSKIISAVLDITKDKTGNFSKPVTITLTFDKSQADSNKYDIGIYWFDADASKWVKLDNMKIDTEKGTVSGEVSHFTRFAVIAAEKAAVTPPVVTPVIALNDIAGNWAEANIKRMVASGAVSGYPDGTFKPDNTITRAEFAAILVKAFKLEPKTGKTFNDTANHWAKESIATAAACGIVNGYSDNIFGPNDNITREQMAVMVCKAASLTNASSGKTFADEALISVWAKESVTKASAQGIISGYPDNTFRPAATATRAEAVTVILKAQ